jgi:putative transposase
MTRPLRIEFEGATYHVTSRGNERNRIFFTPRDYGKFKEYIAKAQSKFDFVLHCFVLMTNHYHLLIGTPHKNLNRIMHYINSSYTTYTNTKRNRIGHLFQGRYKAIVIDKDSYLTGLSRYMHLNPVRAKIVKTPEEYPYSSYRSYIESGVNESIVTHSFVLALFAKDPVNARSKYKKFVEDGMQEDLENPLSKVFAGTILGDEDFVLEVMANVGKEELENEEVAHRKALSRTLPVGAILARLTEYFAVPIEEITRKGSDRRKICVYLLKRYADVTYQEINEVIGGSGCSSAAKIYQRFVKDLGLDADLKKVIEDLETF